MRYGPHHNAAFLVTRYIFTVTAGRSGQNSLTDLLVRHVPNCYAAFEEPQLRLWSGGRLAHHERRFRRRYVETHELLGRGRVLQAFSSGEDDYIERIARRRMRAIERELRKRGSTIYVDVSKFFARGLHRGFLRLLPSISVIHLVRDPIANMRSFMNRNKDFYLDNNAPDSLSNILKLDPSELNRGELFLWAWCEMYLRYKELADNPNVDVAVEIRTDELTNPERLTLLFDALGLPHKELVVKAPMNTNVSQGYCETEIKAEDVELFRRFVARLPEDVLNRIPYLRDHESRRSRSVVDPEGEKRFPP